MREHLYKGKRISDNKWTFGGISYAKDGAVFIVTTAKDNLGYITLMEQVYPETVCKYTGLPDKNGDEIFENDIVRFYDKDWAESGIATVDFESGKWKINGQYTTNISSIVWLDLYRIGFEYEVIGNKIDNPELLED